VSYFNVDMFAPSPTVFPFYVASSTLAAGSAHSPGPRRKLDSQCDVSSGLHVLPHNAMTHNTHN